MLLAEDLLLLLTDDASGRPVLDGTRLDLVLAGAVVLELAVVGRADVTGPGEPVRAGRLVARDPSPTGDQVLDEALRRIAARRPSKPETVLPGLAKQLRPALLARLTERGILRAEEGRVLGIFPTRAWPATDSSHEDGVRRGLHEVLVVGRAPAPREAALISLLDAAGQVPKVLAGSGVDRRELRRRARDIAAGEFAGGEFAGAAVRRAIDAVTAATMVAISAGAVAASGGS
ncbi:GOLPH3/VPS74 family protein [Georgenia thermotolerans]|uniref:GPP34 family phosphoprotein n=1 Tax=Georgenia thermotolerans TaxID=527326 RepID=A0A7J5UK51_9MICO|nr:GPP34 family phosphoprotein [Georgenia thermotolerans]KAE8762779.1 GPP34 family phosphoprotein [Georgenia thermotolerans]